MKARHTQIDKIVSLHLQMKAIYKRINKEEYELNRMVVIYKEKIFLKCMTKLLIEPAAVIMNPRIQCMRTC